MLMQSRTVRTSLSLALAVAMPLTVWGGAPAPPAGAASGAASHSSQQPAPADNRDQRPLFRAATDAVLVDVVVRDREGRPVTDLTVDDFEVFESGTRQQISSFDVVSARRPGFELTQRAPQQADRTTPPAVADRGPAVIALAFEQLGPEGRKLALEAARQVVGERLDARDFAGVFAIDGALHVLTPYTTDRAAIADGLDRAGVRAGFPRRFAGRVPGAEYSSPAPGQPAGATADDHPSTRGHFTLAALERLIDGLKVLPGRKAVLLFSEGLALDASSEQELIPTGSGHSADTWLDDNRYDRFLRLVTRANRAQVSFYTFDAGGLRIEGPMSGFGRSPWVGLKFLADETGGAFVENTNDLGPGAARVLDDLQHYYVLGYTSTRTNFDGRFRTIEVKVKRRGVTVLARRGYRATREPDRLQVRTSDVAPLLLLEGPVVPNDFPVRHQVLAMPEPVHPGRVLLLAQVPGDAPAFYANGTGGREARLALLARVKNADGHIVGFASAASRVREPGAAGVAPRDLLFHRTLDLPPGVHTLELIAYDEIAARASARFATVEIAAPGDRPLLVSSLLLAATAHPLADSTRDRPALALAGHVIGPRFDRTLVPEQPVLVAFAAWTRSSNSEPLEATAGLLKDGAIVATMPLELPRPDAKGRVEFLGRLALGKLEPGTYQLAATVRQNEVSETRMVTVRVAESLEGAQVSPPASATETTETTETAEAAETTEDLTGRLTSPDLDTRMRAVEELSRNVAQRPSILRDVGVQRAVVRSLEIENELVQANYRGVTEGGESRLTEAYSEHYSVLLGVADQLQHDAPPDDPELADRLARALVFGSYDPQSEFVERLSRTGEPLVPHVLERANCCPFAENAYALMAALLDKQQEGTLRNPLSPASVARLRAEARKGLAHPSDEVARWAIAAVAAGDDRDAIPVLRQLAAQRRQIQDAVWVAIARLERER
jgi:VWFA-related protein